MPPKEPMMGRSTALDMLQTEQGVDPMMRNPMSGASTEEVFVDKALLPDVKEGQEITGRFTVGKVGSKVSLKPIEFLTGESEKPELEIEIEGNGGDTGTTNLER